MVADGARCFESYSDSKLLDSSSLGVGWYSAMGATAAWVCDREEVTGGGRVLIILGCDSRSSCVVLRWRKRVLLCSLLARSAFPSSSSLARGFLPCSEHTEECNQEDREQKLRYKHLNGTRERYLFCVVSKRQNLDDKTVETRRCILDQQKGSVWSSDLRLEPTVVEVGSSQSWMSSDGRQAPCRLCGCARPRKWERRLPDPVVHCGVSRSWKGVLGSRMGSRGDGCKEPGWEAC